MRDVQVVLVDGKLKAVGALHLVISPVQLSVEAIFKVNLLDGIRGIHVPHVLGSDLLRRTIRISTLT